MSDFDQLIEKRMQEISSINKVRGPLDEASSKKLQDLVLKSSQLRGRDLFYPFVSSGRGNGPFVELVDGSVKLDFIGGIGVYLFGHCHPVLMKASAEASLEDMVMQGNLLLGQEFPRTLGKLLELGSKNSKLKYGWLSTCGTMVNEIALKIIRQKLSPKYHILALEKSFAGRSTTMQELTDNSKLRQGQPLHGEFHHFPYFNPSSPSPLEDSLKAIKNIMNSYSEHIGAACLELIQGEGGFIIPPKDYVQNLVKELKNMGLIIWVDEIQTFGRTGQLFAFETFGIGDQVDIVTLAKILQLGGCMWKEELNPKAGLIAGTFNGNTGSLRAAEATLTHLSTGNYLGYQGKINTICKTFNEKLTALGKKNGKISEVRNAGAMLAFKVFDGALETTDKFLKALFKNGVIGFQCGRGPYYVRFLLPAVVLNESHIDEGLKIIDQTISEMN